MGKRLLIWITVLLIAGIATGWYFFARESKYFGTSPIRAVPVESPFFVRIRNLGDFATKTKMNKSWQSLQSITQIAKVYHDFVFIDSLILQNSARKNFFRHKELIYVPGDSSNLYLLEIGSISEKNSIHSVIRNYFQSKKIIATESEFRDASVEHYEWIEKGEKKRAHFSFYKGILIVCNEVSLLQKALEQTENRSVLEDSDYMKVSKNSTENSDLNIFINHKTFPSLLNRYYADSTLTGIFRPDYAKWTEVDVLQKENQLLINGFTIADSTRTFFVDIYKHQKPVEGSLVPMMPVNTSYFIVQALSNPNQYFDDLIAYLVKSGKSVQYRQQLSALSKELKIDVSHYLVNNWAGEAAVVYTNNNLKDSADNRFLLLRIKNGTNDLLFNALKKWAIANRTNSIDFGLTNSGSDEIFEMPDANFGNLLGVSYFSSIKTKWMILGDEFILMGSTPGSLKRYMDCLGAHQFLIGKSSYQRFTSVLSKTSNFYFWCAPGQALSFFEQAFQPDLYRNFKRVISSLAKIENMAWQYGYEKGMTYNTASLNVNPSAELNWIPFWSIPLKAKTRNKPQFISYSEQGTEKDLVFQDVENNLTDMDGDGTERWKVHLEGMIIGEIKTIDYRKNGDFQLLFNTKDAIHLIDRKGVEIKNYPIRLKSEATNEISVFDYEGKRDYRYLLACRDHKVYNLDKYGKMTPGWQTKVTQSMVEMPVRYFRVGSRDYIAYSDHTHTYILDRQGKERVKISDDFVHSKNDLFLLKEKNGAAYIVTTEEHGKIRLIGFDGSSRKIVVGNFSGNHNFLPVTFMRDGSMGFLFLDKQTVFLYDLAGKIIFSHPVVGLPDEPMKLSVDADTELIEIYLIAANRAIFLRKDGSIFDANLPNGFTPFTIGSFNIKSGVSNLLALSADGFLTNFQIIGK